MPQAGLLSGVVADENGEFVQSLPLNLEPLAVDNKLSKGQLRMTSGSTTVSTGAGPTQGAITWDGQHYRVNGGNLYLVAVDGVLTLIGALPSTARAIMDYSFDRLGIAIDKKLFYYRAGALTQVADEDLGSVVDMLMMDGYTITTDGKYIVVTELNDPTSIKPLKYGSAEQDPDMITGLHRLGAELLVVGGNSIEFFQNVGGNGFPFQVQKGATIRVGCVGPYAKCDFAQTMAFVGGGRDESSGVHIVGQGTATKLSTRAVDIILAAEHDPASIILESRVYKDEQRLFVHLSGQSLVYLVNASAVFGEPVWYRVQSGYGKPYRIRDAIPAYGKMFCGDLNGGAIGILSDDVATHFAEKAAWQFDVTNSEMNGSQLHSVELFGLPGRGADPDPVMFMSMTRDGRTFSVERPLSMGRQGERTKRMQWRPHAMFRTFMGVRFRGLNANAVGFSACNLEGEPLAV
jgi:hypothetical protein